MSCGELGVSEAAASSSLYSIFSLEVPMELSHLKTTSSLMRMSSCDFIHLLFFIPLQKSILLVLALMLSTIPPSPSEIVSLGCWEKDNFSC